MTRRQALPVLLALAALVVAALWVHELQRRVDVAARLQAAAMASQTGAADLLATTREHGATVIRFDRGVAPNGLVSGWSTPEPDGIWSWGGAGVVRLLHLPSGRPAGLVLTVRPFLAPGRPTQRVRVRAGAALLAEFALSAPGFQDLHLDVPAAAQSPAGTAELTFDLPDADSPARLSPGASDYRTLAIMLKAIAIAP